MINLIKNFLIAGSVFLSTTLSAAIIPFSGSFSMVPSENTSNPQGPTTLSGTFEFSFDDSAVLGNQFESFGNIVLTSFSLNPNSWGSTTFSITNVGAELRFHDGSIFPVSDGSNGLPTGLFSVFIGGNADGSVSTISDSTDDFYIEFFEDGTPERIRINDSTEELSPSLQLVGGGGLTGSVVPESSIYSLLVGLATLSVAIFRRKVRT